MVACSGVIVLNDPGHEEHVEEHEDVKEAEEQKPRVFLDYVK